MGAGESKEPIVVPAVPPVSEVSSSLDNPEEKFQEEVRKAAGQFKSLVQGNKVMMFSATYCSYCSVAKRTLDEFGTTYQALEVNKLGEEGDMLMNVVSAVTGKRMVPAIFICGQHVPGGSSGLKHLISSGELSGILEKCCEGDVTCSEFGQFRLHGH